MAVQLKKLPQCKSTKYFCIIIDMEFFFYFFHQVLYLIIIMRLNIYNLYIFPGNGKYQVFFFLLFNAD